MSIVLGANNYGKSDVRLVKVTRKPGRHELRDVTVDVALEGEFEAAHVAGDNTDLLATDTMRNTVYALAKDHPLDDIEAFGVALVARFVEAGPLTTRARVRLVEHPWDRLVVVGRPHEHAFQRGSGGNRTATVTGDGGETAIEAGIEDLLVLKTTESGWEGYLHDRYTTLPETAERILATAVSATWSYRDADVEFGATWAGVRQVLLGTFAGHYSRSVQQTLYLMGEAVLEAHPQIEHIRLSLPNKHHLLYDLSRFGLENANEIFHATTEPYGLIEGTVERTPEPARPAGGASRADQAPA
ncbi:MAG: factor-independent urate hydroxylase [Solirubrobacteraceae bacterium]